MFSNVCADSFLALFLSRSVHLYASKMVFEVGENPFIFLYCRATTEWGLRGVVAVFFSPLVLFCFILFIM